MTFKKSGYHKDLKLLYNIEKDAIIFQDGVVYSNKEIKILKNSPGFDYEIIHFVKKLFEAEVIE